MQFGAYWPSSRMSWRGPYRIPNNPQLTGLPGVPRFVIHRALPATQTTFLLLFPKDTQGALGLIGVDAAPQDSGRHYTDLAACASPGVQDLAHKKKSGDMEIPESRGIPGIDIRIHFGCATLCIPLCYRGRL